jgi:hypothetical protein
VFQSVYFPTMQRARFNTLIHGLVTFSISKEEVCSAEHNSDSRCVKLVSCTLYSSSLLSWSVSCFTFSSSFFKLEERDRHSFFYIKKKIIKPIQKISLLNQRCPLSKCDRFLIRSQVRGLKIERFLSKTC